MSDRELQHAEKWASINGYEGLYEISTFGCVRSVERFVYGKSKRRHAQRTLKHMMSASHGYPSVSLCSNGIKKSHLIHKLIAEAFLPKDPVRTYVNHIDGDKLNCRLSNLEWVTNRENITHSIVNLRGKEFGVGVIPDKKGRPWRATVYHNGSHVNVGKFDTKELAMHAYVKKIKELGIENKYIK